MNFIEKPIKPKPQNTLLRLFKFFIWIWVIIAIIIYFDYKSFPNETIINTEQIITIEEWETFENIAEELNINKIYLRKYIKNNTPDLKLIVWDFQLKENSKIDDILEALKTPIIYDEVNITFLEWWNIYDNDDFLSKKWYFEEDVYIYYVTNPEKIEALSEFFPFIKWLNTLEWFLYPDTYKINTKETQINQLVISQLENFETKVYNKFFIDSNWNQTYTNQEIVDLINLASIVEKEEKNTANKKIVAWILKKRLDEWWMIWADITVCYPHKLTSEECKMVVSKYIQEISEYNTRTMAWLPKTPIWNPSYETIDATLNYKETPYYFYLHNTETWEIYYAETNAEHEANKRYMK